MGMHVREQRGPSGEIELSYQHESSASGAKANYTSAKLVVEEGSVVLITERHYDTAYDFSNVVDVTRRYIIAPNELIELIKKHGSKV
jgi:hypothetical protein